MSPLTVSSSSYPNIDAVRLTGEPHDDELSIGSVAHDASGSNVDMLARQADVRTKPPSREVSTAAWPPLYPHGSWL